MGIYVQNHSLHYARSFPTSLPFRCFPQSFGQISVERRPSRPGFQGTRCPQSPAAKSAAPVAVDAADATGEHAEASITPRAPFLS